MRWIAIAGALALAALLAGCGGGSDGDAGGTGTGAAVSGEEATTNAGAAGGGEAAEKNGDGSAKRGGGAGQREGAAGKRDGAAGMRGGVATKQQSIAGEAGGTAKIEVVDSQFGEVIADASGEALYLFDKEAGPSSECYGECAVAWPPLLTSGRPRAGSGAEAGLLGTTEREDGELQVTYDGHPLYYYVDDSPGTILCHNVPEFGGLWLVVQPDGEAVA